MSNSRSLARPACHYAVAMAISKTLGTQIPSQNFYVGRMDSYLTFQFYSVNYLFSDLKAHPPLLLPHPSLRRRAMSFITFTDDLNVTFMSRESIIITRSRWKAKKEFRSMEHLTFFI